MTRCISLARNRLHIFSALGRQSSDYTNDIAWKFKVNTSTIGYDNPGNFTARLSIDSSTQSSIAIIPTTKRRNFQIEFSLDSIEDEFTVVSDHVENHGDSLKQNLKAEERSSGVYNHVKNCWAALYLFRSGLTCGPLKSHIITNPLQQSWAAACLMFLRHGWDWKHEQILPGSERHCYAAGVQCCWFAVDHFEVE